MKWPDRIRPLLRGSVAVAVVFWIGASIIMIAGDEPLPYSVGMTLKRPVLSRVAFERRDDLATEKARSDAQHAVPNYFKLNRQLIDNVKAEFRDMYAAVSAAENLEKFLAQHANRWRINQEVFDALKRTANSSGADRIRASLDTLDKHIIDQYLIERDHIDREIRSTADHVILVAGPEDTRRVSMSNLRYVTNPDQVESAASVLAQRVFPGDSAVRQVFKDRLIAVMSPGENKFQPIYSFDATETRARVAKAADVLDVNVLYAKDDRLVTAPKQIGQEEFALLKAEHEEYLRQRHEDPALRAEWRNKRIGLFGFVTLLTIGLALFTWRTQPRILDKTPRAVGVAVLLLGMLLLERFVVMRVSDSPIWCVLPVAMTAAILTIAYSQPFALGAAGALALLTSVMLGASYGMTVVLLTVAASTVLMLREIRTRMKMLEVGGVVSTVAYVSTFAMHLARGDVMFMGDPLYAAIAAMAGLSMVHVLLPIIERAFKVTTSQTLLEWADTSRPMLRQLIEKAPGTWQHSHLLGSMAESAAEEIGANGLLVRVGAYYHDIGKICKPNYFVENQEARMNAHRGLAPTMSLLVILAHVKDGLALAREQGLPPILHQFIAEHHGTTLVKYFHHMATQEAKAAGGRGREISETEFRYPGPKPRSREAAILMLCDGVEGAVRSLQEPTPSRIETVVHDIVMARLMDGQFDDCDITLKELAKVEQSLVRSLRAIHHGRISYPKQSEPVEAHAKTA